MDQDRGGTEMNYTREEHKQVKITIPPTWNPEDPDAFNRWVSKLPII